MEPSRLINIWVETFNKGDADAVAALYDDDAINHQVANDPVQGKAAIREMFVKEFSRTKMECIVENIFQDGEWGILEWKDPLGLRGCGFFCVRDGKIKFQRGYWDKLSFLRTHNLPFPKE
jgi:limonene-1,2-epoxide hydrolase